MYCYAPLCLHPNMKLPCSKLCQHRPITLDSSYAGHVCYLTAPPPPPPSPQIEDKASFCLSSDADLKHTRCWLSTITGLDYWTDQFYHKIHNCGLKTPCLELSLNRCHQKAPPPPPPPPRHRLLWWLSDSYKPLILWICFSRGAHQTCCCTFIFC